MASRMSKKIWLRTATFAIAILALVGIALSYCSLNPSDSTPALNETPASNETSVSNKTQALNEALDFTLPTLTGANITLSELKGTPVVLNFWSTCCPYCRQQLPYFDDVAQQSEGVIKVIAINIYDSASEIQDFFGDYKPTMTIALDSNREVFTDYSLAYNNARGSIPFTLFIDSEGIVKYVKIGAFASEAELWDTLHSVF
jgi:peroxiredoxin